MNQINLQDRLSEVVRRLGIDPEEVAIIAPVFEEYPKVIVDKETGVMSCPIHSDGRIYEQDQAVRFNEMGPVENGQTMAGEAQTDFETVAFVCLRDSAAWTKHDVLLPDNVEPVWP